MYLSPFLYQGVLDVLSCLKCGFNLKSFVDVSLWPVTLFIKFCVCLLGQRKVQLISESLGC